MFGAKRQGSNTAGSQNLLAFGAPIVYPSGLQPPYPSSINSSSLSNNNIPTSISPWQGSPANLISTSSFKPTLTSLRSGGPNTPITSNITSGSPSTTTQITSFSGTPPNIIPNAPNYGLNINQVQPPYGLPNTTSPLQQSILQSMPQNTIMNPQNYGLNIYPNQITPPYAVPQSNLASNNFLLYPYQQGVAPAIGGGQPTSGAQTQSQPTPNYPLWLRFLPKKEAGGVDRVGTDTGLLKTGLLAGGMGLAGNLAQIGIDRLIYGNQADFKNNIQQQAALQQQIMEQYLPMMTTNRLGQFGNQAAIEAQRRSAEASYSVPALANLARANQSAAALENLATQLGSQAIQAASRQNRNIREQLASAGGPMTPAALSAIARGAAQGSAQAYDQALQQALAAASQNIAQAGQMRTGATQAAEQAAQRVYETYKRPAETETDLKALASFAQTPMQLGMQQAERHHLVVGNPLQAAAQTMLNDAANLSYLKRMEEAQKVGVQNEFPAGPSDYSGVYDILGDPQKVDALMALMYNSNMSPNTFQHYPNLVTKEEHEIYKNDPNKRLYVTPYFNPNMLIPPPPPPPPSP